MIVTTCETIPGHELEYVGLVAGTAFNKTSGGVTRKGRAERNEDIMADLEQELTAAAQRKHADAVVGVRLLAQDATLLTLVGTAVRFR